MTAKEIEIDGSGRDGLLAMWEPSDITMEDLSNALKAIGKEGLLPKSSVAKAALKEALYAFICRTKLAVRGNTPELFPLAPEVVGYEARRMNKGTENNSPEFIMSVVVDANGVVSIPKHDSNILPQLDNHKAKVEAAIQGVFDTRVKWYPTGPTSTCIARVIESLGGILVRKTGGSYFLPEKGIEKFEEFCAALDSSKDRAPEMVTYRFPIKPGTRSFKSVLQAVKRNASDRLAEVESGLQELGTKKQRSNGQESRLNECVAVKEMLAVYSEALGVELKDFMDMADKVQSAVAAHNALDWCT
jgi:hypothetical protein